MPEIHVDDEVFAAMQEEALPFVDEPNDVLRRKFGLAAEPAETSAAADAAEADGGQRRGAASPGRSNPPRRRGRARAPRGTLLPESAYEGPILRVLAERNGEAPAREATDAVEPLIAEHLTALDRERTKSGEIRWRNRTQFARLALVNRGLIDKEAPRGIWRLTEEGRAAAAKVAA
jgi:hypothetical protein